MNTNNLPTSDLMKLLEAINKWIYFGWNYNHVMYEWTGDNGQINAEYVPEFLTKIDWSCTFDHMYSKWFNACEITDSDGRMVRFYADLDNFNQIIFLQYVMENYNGELKLS